MLAEVVRASGGSGSQIWLSVSGEELRGIWCGDQPFSVGDVVDVELDAREPHSFEDLAMTQGTKPHFEILGDQAMRITGRVIEIDHNGVMTLEVGNTLLSLEMEGAAPVEIVGATVSVVIRDLEVHATGM